jgi:ABC-type multidrug transport system fused ATPase/permease subunit
MWSTFVKLRDLLNARERRQIMGLLAVILVMGFVESTRVVSVIPFVAVLADPSIVQSNAYLAAAYAWLGYETVDRFLVFLGVAMFLVLIGALLFSAFTNWAVQRFTAMRSHTLSLRLLSGYLHRPYEWFLGRHSADLGKTVLSEVNQVVGGALMPALTLATQGVVAACLVALLLWIDPVLAVIVAGLLGGGYFLAYWVTRRYLSQIGEDRLIANGERFRLSSEAFGGIKEVKVLGLEDTYVRRFEKPSLRMVRFSTVTNMIGMIPQYTMEALVFAIVVVIVQYQMLVRGELAQALPAIALYVMAGSRLRPALQNIYKSSTSLRAAGAVLSLLHRDLSMPVRGSLGGRSMPAAGPLRLEREIELRQVRYRYPGGARPAIRDLSLTIPARAAIGLVGHTGAGKTSVVDVILGLLEPEGGQLLVDGNEISDDNRRSWQDAVGYVPQHIFLSDDTVTANIAFGVPSGSVDMAAVERAARIANLHRFVSEELPNGYDTLLGERGVRLSGGERQRVGIARALYHDPELLIMDEATSALDNVTERAVMDAVDGLANRKTVILIAHRLTTVRRCDTIFLLERGRLVASGTYDQLVARSDNFRRMVDSAIA